MDGPKLALVLFLGLCGCDIGTEKFIAPGAGGVGLASHNGLFWIIPGYALHNNGTNMGSKENLLYVLVVCPELYANSHGDGVNFGQRYNTYRAFWGTRTGDVTVAVTWDKRADKVKIGKQQFSRDLGNTFVVVRQPPGELRVTQLPSAGPDADAEAALRHIQLHMTNDALVSSVELHESGRR
jgi:hypothetical protein